jgi:hypothetical protein
MIGFDNIESFFEITQTSESELQALERIKLEAFDYAQLFPKRKSLKILLDQARARLNTYNPSALQFLPPSHKTALRKELYFIRYLLKARLSIADAENNTRKIKQLLALFKKTETILKKIKAHPSTLDETHEAIIDDAQSPQAAIFLGEPIARQIATNARKIILNPHQTLRTVIDEINKGRAAWSGQTNLATSIAGVLPEKLGHTNDIVNAPGIVPGVFSFSVYYARFFLDSYLLLRHSVKGRWMSEQQSRVRFFDLLHYQWQLRGNSMLSDFVKATTNMCTLFWLTGSLQNQLAGSILSIGVVIFDVILTAYIIHEEKKELNKKLIHLQAMKDKLNAYLLEIEAIELKTEEDLTRLVEIKHHLDKTEKMIREHNKELRYKSNKQRYDLIYGVTTFLTAGIFLGILYAPNALAILNPAISSLVCTSVLFAAKIVYTVTTGMLDIRNKKETIEELTELKSDLLQKYAVLKQNSLALTDSTEKTLNANERKGLFLEIQDLEAKTNYQHRLIRHKKYDLARDIIFDLTLPLLVILGGLSLTTPAGIGIVVGFILLNIITKIILNAFAPVQAQPTQFNQEKFLVFDNAQISQAPEEHAQTPPTTETAPPAIHLDPALKKESSTDPDVGDGDDVIPLTPLSH